MARKPVFTGSAHIYLQGKNALLPIEAIGRNTISYYIGEKCTNLVITDNRNQSVNAANEAITTGEVDSFPHIFNQPARVVINEEGKTTKIELFEGTAGEDDPILWMGVLNDKYIPIHYLIWQKFIDIQDQGIAFAALISD
jgi:hypothetical protein